MRPLLCCPDLVRSKQRLKMALKKAQLLGEPVRDDAPPEVAGVDEGAALVPLQGDWEVPAVAIEGGLFPGADLEGGDAWNGLWIGWRSFSWRCLLWCWPGSWRGPRP